MDKEVTVSGHALLGESLEQRPVTIVVKSGIITHIEDDPHPGDTWIVPAFFNAHTHLGDTIAMDANAIRMKIDFGDVTVLLDGENDIGVNDFVKMRPQFS